MKHDMVHLAVAIGIATTVAWGQGAAEDPWAPLHLVRVGFKGGAAYIDPALVQQREAIVAGLDEYIEASRRQVEEVKALEEERPAVIRTVNEMLGFKPSEKQAEAQSTILAAFTRAPMLAPAPPSEFRAYVLLSSTAKDYMRNGGRLPCMSYDTNTGRASFSLTNRLLSTTTSQGGPTGRVGIAWLPFVVKSSETAAEDLRSWATETWGGAQTLYTGLALHELIEGTLVLVGKMLQPSDLRVRWFAEGLANALAMEVLGTMKSQQSLDAMKAAYEPTKYADMEQDVNLRYWLTEPYSIESSLPSEKRLTGARYAYATLEAGRLLREHGVDSIRRILAITQERSTNRTECLASAIREVTGEDMDARLRRYQRFDTDEEGLAQYGRAMVEAKNAGQTEKQFVNVCRFAEVSFQKQVHLTLYPIAAQLLDDLGRHDEAQNIFDAWIDFADRQKNEELRRTWQAYTIHYAILRGEPVTAYAAADDYLRAKPGDRMAALVRAHRLKQEGKLDQMEPTTEELAAFVDSIENRPTRMAARRLLVEIMLSGPPSSSKALRPRGR